MHHAMPDKQTSLESPSRSQTVVARHPRRRAWLLCVSGIFFLTIVLIAVAVLSPSYFQTGPSKMPAPAPQLIVRMQAFVFPVRVTAANKDLADKQLVKVGSCVAVEILPAGDKRFLTAAHVLAGVNQGK